MKPKSRLVVKGFQEDITHEAVDSPTVTKESVRLIAMVAIQFNWNLLSADVKTAFLQAKVRGEGDKVIAIKPPKEANEEENCVWILRKSLYGLRSAPKDWWKTLSSSLKTLGFQQNTHDQALFMLKDRTGRLIGLLAVHVDDLMATGDATFMKTLEKLTKTFKFGQISKNEFTHIGITFSRTPTKITLSQEQYIKEMKKMEIQDQPDEEQLNPKETREYQKVLGELMWVACSTRPDVSSDASILAGRAQHPKWADARQINKVIQYLQQTAEEALVYTKLGHKLKLLTYSDSAFQNLPKGRSQGGHIVMLTHDQEENQERKQVNVLSWKSSRVHRVVRSTFTAELLSLTQAFDNSMWLKHLLQDCFEDIIDLDMKTDCQSLVDSMNSLRQQCTEKRLTAELWSIREAISETQDIRSLTHVSTKQMIADGLTKTSFKLKQPLTQAMQGFIQSSRDTSYNRHQYW